MTGHAANTSRLTRRKKIVFIFIAIVGGSILLLLIGELCLRLIWTAPPLPLPVHSLKNDPHTVTALVPNYEGYFNSGGRQTRFKTNSMGQRDREHTLQKAANTFRILVLGDSYVQGHGVEYEDMFATRLESHLAERYDSKKIEVIKAGVGGWGPVNELNYLKHYGIEYNPDLVIVCFFRRE